MYIQEIFEAGHEKWMSLFNLLGQIVTMYLCSQNCLATNLWEVRVAKTECSSLGLYSLGLEHQLSPWLAMWPWVYQVIFLTLNFLIHRIGIKNCTSWYNHYRSYGYHREIKEDYKQLYTYKFNNLGEINQFHEGHNLLKFAWEEIDNLNRPVSIKEIINPNRSVNNLLRQKAPRPNGFSDEFYQTFLKSYTKSL